MANKLIRAGARIVAREHHMWISMSQDTGGLNRHLAPVEFKTLC